MDGMEASHQRCSSDRKVLLLGALLQPMHACMRAAAAALNSASVTQYSSGTV
jgi:hypothetical protein